VLAAAVGPEQVRLVFHYEVGRDDAERAARAIVAATA